MDMDFREPTRHYPQQPAYREAPPQQQPQQQPPEYHEAPPQHYRKKGGKGKGFLKFLLILILIAAAGAGAWYYRDTQAKDDAKQQAQQISDLQDQLSSARDAAAAANTQTQTAQTGPSDDTLKKVEDAISSGKYTDLKVLMGDKVYVVVAASDGLGSRTPEQAVNDLKTLASTKDWDFKLTAKTVAAYQDGDYSVYFPTGALVGKSSDGHVVSIVFNDEGKITGIFMAASDKDL